MLYYMKFKALCKIDSETVIVLPVRKISKRLILTILGFLVITLVAEGVLRLFSPQVTLTQAHTFSFPCFEEGEFRWIKLASNKTCELRTPKSPWFKKIVKTNSLGLRNREVIMPKPSGLNRIIFIGDSFTMGWGVEENESYPRVVETLLKNKMPTVPVETINAGFTAAGPSGYYLYLKNHALTLSPDIVVIGLYFGNDITSRLDVEWVETDEYGLPAVVRSKTTYIDYTGQMRFRNGPLKYKFPVLSETHLFLFMMDRLFPPNQTPEYDPVITPHICIRKANCYDLDKQKEEVRRLFLGMKRLTDTKGAKLLVAMIPTEYTVYDNKEEKYGLAIPLLPSEKHHLQDEFGGFFDENGIGYLDLRQELLKHADQELYFLYDDHWNPDGHNVAAQAISGWLVPFLSKN